MKIGDYVRTKYGITQFKYYKIPSGHYLLGLQVNNGSNLIFADKGDIIKSSSKLVNVLEDGDIAIVINEKGETEYHRYVDSNEPNIEVDPNSNPKLVGIITKEQIEEIMWEIN